MEDSVTSPRGSVVWRDYLRTVIDYVHLNPGRVGLVDGATTSCLDYPWSSLANSFRDRQSMIPPGSRKP